MYKDGIMLDVNDGTHKICFNSVDNLGNEEMQMCQVFFVDNTSPSIEILNPSEDERNIEKCAQSVVALVNDNGSGVKKVWAELWNESEKVVRTADMKLTIYGTYEAFMDKQLPAGDYMLKIMAEDNIGNVNEVELEERLLKSVFVESISPAQCSVNPLTGGSCQFTFNVCMRGANEVSFSLDKLGGIITPAMMNAMISKNGNSTFVGLLDERIEAGKLSLSNDMINGKTSFNLNLDIPADMVSSIGKGVHPLDFSIKSFMK